MIQNVKLYTVLNSYGTYAVHVRMWTRSGCYTATVPVHGQTLEDMTKMKVLFSSLRTNLIGLNEEDWVSFDSFLNQLNMGGKSIHPGLSLALSLACARAATQNELWKLNGIKRWFPYIMGTIILGKDWKEFLVVPDRERTVMEAFETLLEVWNIVGGELKEKGLLRGRSVRGAWLSDLGDLETLYFLRHVADDWKMRLGVNVGGDDLWDGKSYRYRHSRGTVIRKHPASDEQTSLLSALTEQYKIWYMEDPFHGSDFLSYANLGMKLEDTIIAGSALYKADIGRIRRGMKVRSTKAVTINPVYLPTVSHLAAISEFTRGNGLKLVLSRFETETGDSWVSDLSVAFRADMLKVGIMESDNISKFNRLLEIWEDVPSPAMGKICPQEQPALRTARTGKK
ncbi:MAG: hypothetical protein JXC85_04685 [Candidatus Aenigmarchaeota archaeon]|nr:hypothetical protein [Candidatus Aenigmarchaeota archaeon]